MGKYFLDEATFKVEFPDGQWCEIKEELSQKDQDFLINKMAKARVSKDATSEIDLGKQALLERMIKGWSFTDESGNKVPVNSDTISNLRTKYRNVILKEIDRLTSESVEFSKN